MHIQKTSSWIGDFLILYACPHLRPMYDQMDDKVFFYDQVRAHPDMLANCEVEVTRGHDGAFGWHDPYYPNQVGNGTTVSVFRKPEYRLISSFLFNMMIPTGNVYSDNNTLPEHVRNAANPLIAYANVPGMSSCQIKMVLGHYCGKMIPELSRVDIEKAKHRVKHEFAFVGKFYKRIWSFQSLSVSFLVGCLTEESVASAALFYAMYGYRGYTPYLQPATKQFRTHSARNSDHQETLLEQLKAHNWADPPEQELYQFVRELFYSRCAQYNVSTIHTHTN